MAVNAREKGEYGSGVMLNRVLKLDSKDNVLIALAGLHRGEQISFDSQFYTLESDVPAKHKFAAQDFATGASIIMYGVLVGKAVAPIRRGELLTTRNIRHQAAAFQEKTEEYRWTPPNVSRWKQREFLGYRRSDGQVGTRNYWIVVPLVFCENRNIGVLKQAFEEELGFAAPQVYRRQVAELARLYADGRSEEIKTRVLTEDAAGPQRSQVFENVDGVRFLLHEGGCGGTREDSNNLCGLIAGYIHHPNVAGATVLSLGCQHAQIGILREELRKRNPKFDKPLVIVE
ncbi:MAG: altronate hydrolase, partial [Acidobacteria bacterium]